MTGKIIEYLSANEDVANVSVEHAISHKLSTAYHLTVCLILLLFIVDITWVTVMNML